jgi:hypothetical protein
MFILIPDTLDPQRRFERIRMSRGGERYLIQARPAFRKAPPESHSGQRLLSPQL